MEHSIDCLFCNAGLNDSEKKETQRCIYCGEEGVSCPSGHYICNTCQTKNVQDLIVDYCLGMPSRNPVEIATTLMKFPEFRMHCPDHHFLVPAVLLSAYCKTKRKKGKLREWIKAAQNRAEKVPGAFCGTHGSCGAAVGTGIFVSLVTGATPLKTLEWDLVNSMTGRSLLRMASYGGPRCCKRVTFLAIQEACLFLCERMGVQIDVPQEIRCAFSSRNEQCLKDNCPFYFG
jgi:hypothetical protein